MYKIQYNFVKPKYGENAKLCYMDKDSSMVYVKTEDIYKITTCFRHTMIFFKLSEQYKISDVIINYNNCVGHMLVRQLL